MSAIPGSIGRNARLFFLASLVFVLFLYVPTLRTLLGHWEEDPNYSHGWLILPASAWLAWGTLRKQRGTDEPRPWLGGAEILAGALLHLFVQVAPWLVVDFLALFLILRGLAHAWGGTRTANALAFPAGFLFFMFPLPVTWTGAAAVWLQDVVSRISAVVVNFVWVCHRRGNDLVIGGLEEHLVVAPECSGLRQIVAFLALAALLARLSGKSLGKGLALCLLSLPVAVVANVLRVLLMVIGARCFGTGWLSGWMHDVPALLTLPVGFILLLLLSRWLLKGNAPAADTPATTEPQPSFFPTPWIPAACCFLAAIGQCGLWWHLAAGTQQAYCTLTGDLSALPLVVAAEGNLWQGHDSAQRDLLAQKIPFADAYISRDYFRTAGEATVNVYAVYSREGKDREHHPEICVRDVGGATEELSFRGLVALDGTNHRAAQRFRFRLAPQQYTTIYYWHYTFPLAEQGQTLSWLQRLHGELRQRPPSVTVQVSCSGSPSALALVEKEFLPHLERQLATLLPAGARLGHERLPIRFLGGR
jgi:exosortase